MPISSGVLTPAYGRDYKSRAAIVADLNAGKDFDITSMMPPSSGYCSIRDLADGQFQVRYNNRRMACMVTIKNGVAK